MSLDSLHDSPERRRVKVYELKNNDWFDRGTGFCTSHSHNQAGQEEPRITVQSEDDHSVYLLDTRVSRDDGYQKQQETLIVWTGPQGIDMALSFQEAEGCAAIWNFVTQVQQRLCAMAPDDSLTDLIDPMNPMLLPAPTLENLANVENIMRAASATAQGRDALAKFVMAPENLYIQRLVPLVAMAETLENLHDLHRLCNIIKTLILLNDNAVIEYVVRDDVILGVVGALEYDPDFPSHKANHRRYLADESKFKQVVKIDNPETTKKIHYTYRLQYLKDVVLARILDDPTFSVLNSLIFYHQVDIVNHIQSNPNFLGQLFAIFAPQERDLQRKKDAVLFIQNCCAVAKTIQAQSRQQLFFNFINHGLLDVVTYALRHQDAAVRVAGTDILVALIDHDPGMMRTYIFRSINEKTKPLTDTLIELLLIEVDLGVKAQMSDAIKVLLDSTASPNAMEMHGRTNGEFPGRPQTRGNLAPTTQSETLISNFYDESAKKLFAPLKALEGRASLSDLSSHNASLFEHLIGILCFFIRQHAFRSKFFTLSEGLHCRVAQLLAAPQKHLQLTALKWFRTCINLQDEYHNRHLIQHQLFGPILDLIEETMPRDNLLNSVCLELFAYIRHEGIKQLLDHIIETYRDRLLAITYVSLFQELVKQYDDLRNQPPVDHSFSTQTAETPSRSMLEHSHRWVPGMKPTDPDEEAYFDTLDAEDDAENALPTPVSVNSTSNGSTPVARSLVAYPEDDDEDEEEGEDDTTRSAATTRPSLAVQTTSRLTDLSDKDQLLADLNDRSPSPGADPGGSGLGRGPDTPIVPSASLLDRTSEKRRRSDDEDRAADDGAHDSSIQGANGQIATTPTRTKRRFSLTAMSSKCQSATSAHGPTKTSMDAHAETRTHDENKSSHETVDTEATLDADADTDPDPDAMEGVTFGNGNSCADDERRSGHQVTNAATATSDQEAIG